MIANPEIADIVVHGSQKISVIGKKNRQHKSTFL